MNTYLCFRTKGDTGNHRFRTMTVNATESTKITGIMLYPMFVKAKTKVEARKKYLNRERISPH